MVVSAGDPPSFPLLVNVLRSGGVAVVPCDTMYGLVGIVPGSEARIRGIKGREEGKRFLQLLAESSWVGRVADFEVPVRLLRYWPGPLTLVVPARAGGTVAVRVPDSSFLRELLDSIGAPLYSTSVNRAGNPPLRRISDIRREFGDEVDLLFDAGDLPPGRPSTVLDVTVRPFRVLRPGAVVLAPEDLA